MFKLGLFLILNHCKQFCFPNSQKKLVCLNILIDTFTGYCISKVLTSERSILLETIYFSTMIVLGVSIEGVLGWDKIFLRIWQVSI